MQKLILVVPSLVVFLACVLIPIFGFLAVGLIFGWESARWASGLAAPEFTRVHHPVLRLQSALVPHIVFSYTGLLVGLFQSSKRSQRHRKFHKFLGYIYVAMVVGVVITGWCLLPHVFGGWLEGVPGVVFGLVLLPCFTLRGVWCALKRQHEGHRVAMARSFALLAAAIAIRAVFVVSILCGVPERVGLGLTFCVVWPLCLIYGEWRIHLRQKGP